MFPTVKRNQLSGVLLSAIVLPSSSFSNDIDWQSNRLFFTPKERASSALPLGNLIASPQVRSVEPVLHLEEVQKSPGLIRQHPKKKTPFIIFNALLRFQHEWQLVVNQMPCDPISVVRSTKKPVHPLRCLAVLPEGTSLRFDLSETTLIVEQPYLATQWLKVGDSL